MNSIQTSRRRPPRSSGRGTLLYKIDLIKDRDGRRYTIYDFERAIRILRDYDNAMCAIHDYGYYLVRPAKELPALLKRLKADTYDKTIPYYKSRPFNVKTDRLHDFILTWEQPIAVA